MNTKLILLVSLTTITLAALTPPPVRAQEGRVVGDLEYVPGGHERQKLDLHLPAQGKNWPLVVWIHGGAWRVGDKKNVGFPLRLLREKGYAVASVNYRYSTQAVFPAQIEDVKAAVRFLRANAEKFAATTPTGSACGARRRAAIWWRYWA